jgi:hypothetical protein
VGKRREQSEQTYQYRTAARGAERRNPTPSLDPMVRMVDLRLPAKPPLDQGHELSRLPTYSRLRQPQGPLCPRTSYAIKDHS